MKERDRTFREKHSGKQTNKRPELLKAPEYDRKGDILVITHVHRVARSVLDLAKIADRLHKKNVTLKVLDQSIDTSTSEGNLMFIMLADRKNKPDLPDSSEYC